MEMKRVATFVLACLLVLALVIPAAANQSGIISLSRISAVMPEITVELKGAEYENSTITAMLDSKQLTVKNVASYDSTVNTSCAYILVDLSGSMRGSFELVKKNIVTYIESLNDQDKVVLITFGETEVTTALDGSEDRATAIEVVKSLRCNEQGTLFYEALSRAYQLSNSSTVSYDREYVIAFSDGIDEQRGSSTFDEVLKLYGSHALPLYAACSYNASKDAADKFGELARVSGGNFSIIKNEKEFGEFLSEKDDVTLISLQADSNFADGKEKLLTIKVDEFQVEYQVPIMRSIPDHTMPEVDKLLYDAGKDAFVIAFSEAVIGADQASAYKITDGANQNIEIAEVFYSESDNSYEIRTKTPIINGVYTFAFSGIRDNSQESNPLSGEKVFNVQTSTNQPPVEEPEGFPLWLVIVLAIVVMTVIGLVVLFVILSSRKNSTKEEAAQVEHMEKQQVHYIYDEPQQNVVKHHIKTPNVCRLAMRIITGKTAEQNIEVDVVSSLIVGRSDACDIYIDDIKLSRQHFAIEIDGNDLYIMDLQSRNGTMLNGIRINNRQQLHTGDKILAGLSDIMITIIGR